MDSRWSGLRTLGGAVAMAAALFCWAPAADATTVTYDFSGDFPPSFTAAVTLDVVAGQALSGTGTITFGTNTFDLSLITLATNGGDYNGATGFRDNHGTDIFGGDTTIPIDTNGLIFAITNNPVWGQDALFAAWADPTGGYTFLISGTLAGAFDVYYLETQGSVLGGPSDATAAPLPPAWTMLLGGLVGIGFLIHRRKKSVPSLIAA